MRIKETGHIAYTTTYVYDANGNLLTKADPTLASAAAYGYNKLNQLVSVTANGTTATYTYNAQGIRTSKLVDGTLTRYLLDGGNVVAEVTDSVVTATYLRGMNLISQAIGESTNYYLYNAHGDVVQLTDSTGTVTKTYSYDAFGNETNRDETDANPFRYCGEYFDTETGTYYLRARYYDPAIGRFTQMDTHWNTANMIYGDNPQKVNERQDALGLKTYSYMPQISAIMQSGNLYVYCVNNPVSYQDRTGRLLGWAIGGLVGGIMGALGAAIEGDDIWAGALSSAASGAITGLAADFVLMTGGTGLFVVVVYAVAGVIGALAEEGINQALGGEASQNLAKDIIMSAISGALGGLVVGELTSLAKLAANKGHSLWEQLKIMLAEDVAELPLSFLEEVLSILTSWILEAGEYIINTQVSRAFS